MYTFYYILYICEQTYYSHEITIGRLNEFKLSPILFHIAASIWVKILSVESMQYPL